MGKGSRVGVVSRVGVRCGGWGGLEGVKEERRRGGEG